MNHALSSGVPVLERWVSGPRFGALPLPEGGSPAPALSFEFFPPKTEALETQLWACIRRLETLSPRFVSVTYGAGGSTRERTHATLIRLVRETDLVPAAHLTCMGASRTEIDEIAARYWEGGGCGTSWRSAVTCRPVRRMSAPTATRVRPNSSKA